MSDFDILDRDQPVHRHTMIEASAGTGKTFAIEHLVTRLLIEPSKEGAPLTLDRLLVVTFTRAATRDLKLRISSNLEQALAIIKAGELNSEVSGPVPDYLIPHLEAGADHLMQTRRRIESALFGFDLAEVLTIHGFCWRMLQTFSIEGGVSLASSCSEEKALSKTKLLEVVRDFIRTELSPELYSSNQLSILLKRFKGKLEKLQTELLKTISKGLEILPVPSFKDYTAQFFEAMQALKNEMNFASDKIIADFLTHVPAFRELSNRSKQVHPEIMEKVTYFANLFDKEKLNDADFERLIEDGVFIVEALAESQLTAKGVFPARDKLNYPDMLAQFNRFLLPIVTAARDPRMIFACMARGCSRLLCRYQEQEERLGFNDLLHQMRQATDNPSFASQIQARYDAVIVDEFQDTDPVQWEVFRKLFAGSNWTGHLYLVGDPKQSIYAFREADIYTYLSAAETLGQDALATLGTNFRSRPKLVEALNTLFSQAKDLFPLPKDQRCLPYRPVKAGKQQGRGFSDQGASLQFLLAKEEGDTKRKITLKEMEESYFFAAIAKEIIHIHQMDFVAFSEFAVLVADRFQAERLIAYFNLASIPSSSQRSANLAESSAVFAMRELLTGILNPSQTSALKVSLSGRVIGMTHDELVALSDGTAFEKLLHRYHELRSILIHEGFALFYSHFMQSSWRADEMNVLTRLLQQEGGKAFYREWQDVAELLMVEQSANNLSPEGLLTFLDEFERLAVDEDERMRQCADSDPDQVTVLTSHVSKGLEFSIVFALGLVQRPPQKEMLFPIQHGDKRCLIPLQSEDCRYYRHLEEIDAEKMRQLYVAMTRAKDRLYLPVAIGMGGHVKIGGASPVELLLARLRVDESNLDLETLYERINTEDGSSLIHLVKNSTADMAVKVLERTNVVTSCDEPVSAPHLAWPKEPLLAVLTRFMQSFTSLSHAKAGSEKAASNSKMAPHDYRVEDMSVHNLPAGRDTGIVLHTIFEKIPFEVVKRGDHTLDLLPWIQPIIEKTPLKEWKEVIAGLVYQTLVTPLPDSDESFCLADVSQRSMFREADFLFACDTDLSFDNAEIRPGFIKGVIDLMFEYKGKYYLLDWKSNWLGDSPEAYTKDNLLSSMHGQDYGLQADIYTEAFRKYLKLFDERPFQEIFGGIYYFFLRGIGKDTGIIKWNGGSRATRYQSHFETLAIKN